MSQVQKARVRRLGLRSLDAVKARLGIRALTSCVEHLTCHHRAEVLGQSIAGQRLRLQVTLDAALDEQTRDHLRAPLTLLGKAAGLQESLAEPQHALLRTMVERHLLSAGSDSLQIVDTARSLVAAGQLQQLPALQPQLEHAVHALGEATRMAHHQLAQVEQAVVAERTARSLEALGYRVRQKARHADILVRGVKGDVSVAAQISADGGLDVDLAGFENTTCQEALAQFNREIEQRGIGLDDRVTAFHGRKDGGVLAQCAALELAGDDNPLVGQGSRRQRRLVQLQRLRQRLS